jgi:hydrogenase maturation protein HypF
MKRAARIVVTGVVQGVGFRPAIYRLATKVGLKGFVRNVGGSEVEIWVEGEELSLGKFLSLLTTSLPPPAELDTLDISFQQPVGYSEFKILPSQMMRIKRSMIPPDIGVCKHCMEEVLNPKDRRFRYAFNSCAWCGPRYSMMYDIPYDRVKTAMKDFPLCNECESEYRDSENERRFHAQGMSCASCGPKLFLYNRNWELMDVKDPLSEVSKLIDEGFIVAIKGLGGYHIASLATDDEVVQKLRERKRRPQKPFAVMALDLEAASKAVLIDDIASKLLESPQRPIVLLPKKEDTPISKFVSPGMDKEGIFLPYTPLHYLILMGLKDKLAIMTSGNPKGRPMCIDEECAKNILSKYVDYFLVHNRKIVNRVDDSVIRLTGDRVTILRRGRGYAPKWIKLPFRLDINAIATGADIHNAGGVGFDDKVVLTQYIGEIDDLESMEDLAKYLRFFIKAYDINISKSIIVADNHPRYRSRAIAETLAKNYGGKLVTIQHHYAHLLSVVADRKLDPDNDYVGIAIDGVGFGDDGNIWGGEIMIFNYSNYRRVGHIKYVPMVGGDRDVIYTARMLLLHLLTVYGEDEVREVAKKLQLGSKLPLGDIEMEAVITSFYISNIMTSSIGRLLDSISALLGICFERTYEGEPAIKLESAARGGKYVLDDEVPYKLIENGNIINGSELINEILINLGNHEVRDLAYSSQVAIGMALGIAASNIVRGRRVEKIIVSGGAAVNTYIIHGIEASLNNEDIRVITPSHVPPNDGGIALGQIAYTYGLNEEGKLWS